jgi:hypothetical protein
MQLKIIKSYSLNKSAKLFYIWKYLLYLFLAQFIFTTYSCGSYTKGSNQSSKFIFGMDKDRTHRYEESQQRRIDDDKQKRNKMNLDQNSKTGSIRYHIN